MKLIESLKNPKFGLKLISIGLIIVIFGIIAVQFIFDGRWIIAMIPGEILFYLGILQLIIIYGFRLIKNLFILSFKYGKLILDLINRQAAI
jgi:hypothetical protein